MAFIGMGASGLFNAFAFSGMNYLFKIIDKDGYEEEIKRHNHAMESLALAKEKWNENQIKKRFEIQKLRQELSDANYDINATNSALEQLRKIETITYENKTFTKQPVLSDYYRPSKKANEYKTLTVGSVGIVSGYFGTKLLTYMFG